MCGTSRVLALDCANENRQQVSFGPRSANIPRNDTRFAMGIETDIDYFMGDKPKKQKMRTCNCLLSDPECVEPSGFSIEAFDVARYYSSS